MCSRSVSVGEAMPSNCAGLPCRENTVEKVALQQLPAGEVLITVAGANVSEFLPLPAAYALVVQGNFRCGARGWIS